MEDGNRAFNRSLLHLAASDGQGRSKSSRHNREFPHIRRIPRGGQTKTELCHSSATFVQILALGLSPTHHIVTGASKRGWATWLVGSVDPRVMAIVPVVMDELNFLDNIKHHYRSLGGKVESHICFAPGWSFALESYWKMNLTLYFNDPVLETLFDIIDPFQYKDMLMLPKVDIRENFSIISTLKSSWCATLLMMNSSSLTTFGRKSRNFS